MKKSSRSIHRVGVALAAFALCGLTATIASATPSTQIWIPSTDIQPYKTVHLNIDSYIRKGKEPNSKPRRVSDGGTSRRCTIGPTVGVLPFAKIQAEVGFDLIYGGANTGRTGQVPRLRALQDRDAGGQHLDPGGRGRHVQHRDEERRCPQGRTAGTNQDIAYGLVAKTLPVVGRLSAGYFVGNKKDRWPT